MAKKSNNTAITVTVSAMVVVLILVILYFILKKPAKPPVTPPGSKPATPGNGNSTGATPGTIGSGVSGLGYILDALTASNTDQSAADAAAAVPDAPTPGGAAAASNNMSYLNGSNPAYNTPNTPMVLLPQPIPLTIY